MGAQKATVTHQAYERGYERGQGRWPGLLLAREAFEKHGERLAWSEARIVERGEDLFLVAAVLEGVDRALAALDGEIAAAAAVVARVDQTPSFIEDVTQEIRLKLLTGDAPKLRMYSGAGSLLAWLRVVATRLALNLKRGDRLAPNDDLPEDVLDGQEVLQLKHWYLADLHQALEASFRRLSARERTLLRLHFIDGLNIERIGVVYRANRATVARWLVAIRTRLFEEVRAELGSKHGLDTADVKSLYRLMERDVHVTMSRILAG